MIRTLTVLDLDMSPLHAHREGQFDQDVQGALDLMPAPVGPLFRAYLDGYLRDVDHGSPCALCRAWTGARFDEGPGWCWQTLLTDGVSVWALCEQCSMSTIGPEAAK